MFKKEWERRAKINADKQFEEENYKNKKVLLEGGWTGTIIGWDSTNGIGDILSFKVQVDIEGTEKIFRVGWEGIVGISTEFQGNE